MERLSMSKRLGFECPICGATSDLPIVIKEDAGE